jgi:predicted SAM-dependent methyltransferase
MKKLHVGCGPKPLAGWVNTDIRPVTPDTIQLDATKPLPFESKSFDRVYTEHFIEHLDHIEGLRFLRECHRILVSGGRIRLATPDITFLFKLYLNPTSETMRYCAWATESFIRKTLYVSPTYVINNFFKNFGHKFIYDKPLLHSVLVEAGFTDIVLDAAIGKSNDPEFVGVEQHLQSIPEEFNAMETFIIEATK